MRYGPQTIGEWLDEDTVVLDGLEPTERGGLRLPPDDRSPNPGWREYERNGEPVGWYANRNPRVIGIYPYSSPRGRVAASPIELETLPPRESMRTRQTPTPVPLGRAWVADRAITPGITPQAYPAPTRKPDIPIAEVVTRTNAFGLAAGNRGWAFGYADEEFKLTPPTAYAFTGTPLADGQGLAMPMPDVNNRTAPYLYYAVTQADGTASTGTIQGFVDLQRAFEPVIYFPGPYNDDGRRPPDKNQTGLGRLPAPKVGQDRPGSRARAWVHDENGPNNAAIQKMRIRFYLQVRTPRGDSLVGIPSREVTINNEREGRVWRFYPPRDFPADWRYGVWCLILPIDQGAPTWYRVGVTRLAGGATFFFNPAREAEEAVGIWGYPGDSAPSRLEHRLFQADPPDPNDPASDGTVIPAPDPSASPDEPFAFGVPQVAVGSYKLSHSEAVEGYPGEGPVSDSAPEVTITNGATQTLRLRPAEKLSLIYNAVGSERRPDGLPDGWSFNTVGGAGQATAQVVDGVLTVQAASAVLAASYFAIFIGPRFTLPEGEDTDMVVAATIDQTRDPAVGVTQLVVRFFNDAGTATDVVLKDRKNQNMTTNSPGTKTLLPRGQRFGPFGTAIPAGSVEARILLKPLASETQWNQIVSVRDVQAWAFGSALRKAEETPPEGDDSAAPATFDPSSPAISYPRGSAWYLGPAPTVEGVSDADLVGVEPDAVIDFTGSTAGGAVPAELGTLQSTGSATLALEADTTSPTGSGIRLAISDGSTNTKTRRQYSRNHGPRAASATRVLGRVPTSGLGKPQRDAIELVRFHDDSGDVLATLRLNSSGQISLVRHKTNGDVAESVVVLSGLVAGDLFDIELAISGGGTSEGVIRATAGRNGPRTASSSFTGLDYTGRLVGTRYVGVWETTSAVKFGVWIYSVVDTPQGDVLYRENPPAPSGYTLPDPDAPANASGAFILEDVNGDKINQWFGVIEPGAGIGKGYGPTTRRPAVVVPGLTYTNTARGRHTLIETERYDETYELPAHQFFVTLTKSGGRDPIYVGSPYGPGADAALVSRTGTNEVADTGMALEQDWESYDKWQTFVVPPEYCEAHIGPVNDFPGVYVLLPHNLFKGDLSPAAFAGDADAAQAARDALREYGAADTGTFEVIIDSTLEATEFTPEPGRVQRWVDFDADHGAGDLAPIAITASSTNEREPYAGFSTPTSTKLDVPERSVIKIAGTLAAIGDERPEIPPGGVFLETRPAVSVLLDQHQRPFKGMVLAGDADDFAAAEENEEPVDGHAFSVRQSDLVERLSPMALVAFTKEAGRALREITANTVLYYKDAFGGDDGTGRSYRIRFYAKLQVEKRALPVRVFGGVARSAYVVSATPEAEILEEATIGPRLHA